MLLLEPYYCCQSSELFAAWQAWPQNALVSHVIVFSLVACIALSACSPEKRSYFNSNLLQHFQDWFHMENPMRVAGGPDDEEEEMRGPDLPAYELLRWVFWQLDVMPSNELISMKEANMFLDFISLNVGPRACASDLFEHADGNHDGSVSLTELASSLGVASPPVINQPKDVVSTVHTYGNGKKSACLFLRVLEVMLCGCWCLVRLSSSGQLV